MLDNKTFAHQYSESLVETAFAKLGYFVYSSKHGKATSDLIVEDPEGYLLRVEVKSSSIIRESSLGTYIEVTMKSTRSNTTSNTIHKFNSNNNIDILAIVSTASAHLKLISSINMPNNSSAYRLYIKEMHTLENITIE